MNEILGMKRKEELLLLGKDLTREFAELIKKNIEIVARSFRSDGVSEAKKIYVQLIDDLQLFFEMIGEIRKIGEIDAAEAYLEEISKVLEELISTYAYEDWIIVADILEYELIPLLENTKEAILLC